MPISNSHYIKIENLRKTFDKQSDQEVLNIENLEISQTEFFCILGPSGCGKSTLLNLISGVLQPSSGYVSINNEKVTEGDPNCIQLFQEYGLFPWKTVQGNVEFGMKVKGFATEKISQNAKEFIDLVGLSDAINKYPKELSGGMQQRTALARALAVNPNILLMDEPFGALDSITRIRLQREIELIWTQTKKTIIWVTHNVDEAIALGDRIAVMGANPGQIISILDVDIPRPRPFESEAFSIIKSKALKLLNVY